MCFNEGTRQLQTVKNSCELGQEEKEVLTELNPGEFKTVSICTCRLWNASGIKIKKGQSYSFKIDAVHNWVDGKVESDPETGWHGSFYKTIGFLFGFLKRASKTGWYLLTGTVGMTDKPNEPVI